jgi:hypothetical protein
MLTTEERLFIAARLLSRARHERKQRQLHPELSKQIRQDIAECARLANKLQATGEGQ